MCIASFHVAPALRVLGRRRGGGRIFGRGQPAGAVVVGALEFLDCLGCPFLERQRAIAVGVELGEGLAARRRISPRPRSCRPCSCRRARNAAPRGSWRSLRALGDWRASSTVPADRGWRAAGRPGLCWACDCHNRKAPVRSRKQAAAPARKRAIGHLHHFGDSAAPLLRTLERLMSTIEESARSGGARIAAPPAAELADRPDVIGGERGKDFSGLRARDILRGSCGNTRWPLHRAGNARPFIAAVIRAVDQRPKPPGRFRFSRLTAEKPRPIPNRILPRNRRLRPALRPTERSSKRQPPSSSCDSSCAADAARKQLRGQRAAAAARPAALARVHLLQPLAPPGEADRAERRLAGRRDHVGQREVEIPQCRESRPDARRHSSSAVSAVGVEPPLSDR